MGEGRYAGGVLPISLNERAVGRGSMTCYYNNFRDIMRYENMSLNTLNLKNNIILGKFRHFKCVIRNARKLNN